MTPTDDELLDVLLDCLLDYLNISYVREHMLEFARNHETDKRQTGIVLTELFASLSAHASALTALSSLEVGRHDS